MKRTSQSAKDESALAREAYRLLAAGRYMSALRLLRSQYRSWSETPLAAKFLLWALNSVDPWNRAWELSGPGIALSTLLGGRAAAVTAGSWGGAHGVTGVLGDPLGRCGLRAIPVEGLLSEAFVRSRVVIVAESHRAPETRLFGEAILEQLAARGATHLALETPFQRPLRRFQRCGVVRPNTEVYAFDPSRAAILRAARRLGLQVVAFDFPRRGHLFGHMVSSLSPAARRRGFDAEARNRARELYMAENIYRRIMMRDPKVRLVVWTSEQHAMRMPPPDYPWRHPLMAAHLEAISGEVPLCIYQMCVDAFGWGGGEAWETPPLGRAGESFRQPAGVAGPVGRSAPGRIPTDAGTAAPSEPTSEGPPHGETTPTIGGGILGTPTAEWMEATSVFRGEAFEGEKPFEQAKSVELAKLLWQAKSGQARLTERAKLGEQAKLFERAELREHEKLLKHAKFLARASGRRMPLKQAWLLEQARLRQETPFGQAFGPATGVPPCILSLVERPIALGADHPWSLERGVDGIILHHRGVEPAMPLWLSAKRVRVPVDVRGAQLVQAIPASEGRGAVPVDQQLADDQSGDGGVTLALPAGKYLLRGVGKDDQVLWEREISV